MRIWDILFLDDCKELLALNTRICASDAAVETVKLIKEIGISKYKGYVQDVVVSREVSIHQQIKKNSLPLSPKTKE